MAKRTDERRERLHLRLRELASAPYDAEEKSRADLDARRDRALVDARTVGVLQERCAWLAEEIATLAGEDALAAELHALHQERVRAEREKSDLRLRELGVRPVSP